ncbi:hypothetical protein [Pseudoalteromonas sp. T1lg23B]|nr:hypothetical protein [Pseudoalteromonas sp. T1lg23B]
MKKPIMHRLPIEDDLFAAIAETSAPVMSMVCDIAPSWCEIALKSTGLTI